MSKSSRTHGYLRFWTTNTNRLGAWPLMGSDQLPDPGETAGESPIRKVADVTCLACGCFCDDLVVNSNPVGELEVRSACEIGRDWFLARHKEGAVAAAVVGGQPVETRVAIERAVSILAESRATVVWGLTRTVTETVRECIGLADSLGARVILDRSELDLGRVAAFQDQGRVAATLGEVKNRADLVVFWGVDPLTTHPRHWERYSVEPRGRFVPEGRAGRTVVVVDHKPTASAARADLFLKVPNHRQIEALAILRTLLRGKQVNRQTGACADGLELSALDDLGNRMKRARYGAFFFQASSESGGRTGVGWSMVSRLVRELNEHGRFVLLGMGAPGNLGGAEAALTWQSGFLQGVDYCRGRPTGLDDCPTLEEVLRCREADAVLAVANGFPAGLTELARAHLRAIPTILIGPRVTELIDPPPSVALATSTVGFDQTGTVIRSDGVGLPLRPVREPRMPSDRELIRKIAEGLKTRKSGKA